MFLARVFWTEKCMSKYFFALEIWEANAGDIFVFLSLFLLY